MKADNWPLLVSKLIELGLTEDEAILAVMYAQAELALYGPLWPNLAEDDQSQAYGFLNCSSNPLWRMFLWDETPEGWSFWQRRAGSKSAGCRE